MLSAGLGMAWNRYVLSCRKIRKGMKLSPFQLVTGKQSEPLLVDDTGKLAHSSINRLKHLGVQVQEKESGDPQEVTN